MSTTTRRSPPTRPPPAKGASASGLARSRLRRNEFARGRHELVGIELRSFERVVTPPYCLSTATVSFQSLSDIHPSGFPAVFGVTHVSNDSSASRRDMAGTVASEN